MGTEGDLLSLRKIIRAGVKKIVRTKIGGWHSDSSERPPANIGTKNLQGV